MQFLSDIAQLIRVSNSATGAQTTITSSAFSMVGFDRVLVIVPLGTATDAATVTVTLEVQDAGNNYVTTDAKVVHVTSTSSNKVLLLDVAKPICLGDGNCKVTVARASQNVALDGVFVMPYCERDAPISQDASIAASAQFTTAADNT